MSKQQSLKTLHGLHSAIIDFLEQQPTPQPKVIEMQEISSDKWQARDCQKERNYE